MTSAPRIFPLVLSCALGCTTVFVEDDDGAPPPGKDSAPLPEPCTQLGDDTLFDATVIARGTLFGDVLHLQGLEYGVYTLRGSYLKEEPGNAKLEGSSAWTAIGGERYVRLLAGRLEVMDAANPRKAFLLSSSELPSTNVYGGPDGIVGVANRHVYFCAVSQTEERLVYSVDLSDQAHPGPSTPSSQLGYACDTFGNKLALRGSSWVMWGANNVALFDLQRTGSAVINWSYAPAGVHSYGDLTALAADGDYVAATMENEDYAFLFYRENLDFPLAYSSFGSGPKQLLSVVNGVALLAVEEDDGAVAIVGFDIHDPGDVFQTDMRVRLESYFGLTLTVVAEDRQRLILSDEDHLFDVPIGAQGTVRPLHVLDQDLPACL